MFGSQATICVLLCSVLGSMRSGANLSCHRHGLVLAWHVVLYWYLLNEQINE